MAKIKIKRHLRRLKKKRKVAIVRKHKRRIKKSFGSTPEWKRAYYQRPEVKAQRLAYQKAYYQRPEIKEIRRAYQRAYRHRPEVKARRQEQSFSRKEKRRRTAETFREFRI